MSTFMNRLSGKLLGLGGGVLLLMAAGVVHAGTVTYVYTDPQGTPLAEANASGTITATFDYAPYGSIALGTAPNGPGYTGHVNDPESGLVYMQARYYDPSVGRFLSTDPVEPSAGNAFNFNRYAYVNNNPINRIDPTGMCADHYKDGSCKVQISEPIEKNRSAQMAQKKIEQFLNKNDKAVNNLKNGKVYAVGYLKNFGIAGNLTGKEIKDIWNTQHIDIVPNGTVFNNGGGGMTVPGLTELTPNVVSGWERASPAGVSSIILHEFSHLTAAGEEASRGNEYDTSGPAFEEREEKVQTIGSYMAGAIGAPFSCSASEYGCY